MSARGTVSADEVPVSIRVVGGGVPTAEQWAAVVVALTPVTVAAVEDATDGSPAAMPGWSRAALREAVTGARVRSLVDLQAAGRA